LATSKPALIFLQKKKQAKTWTPGFNMPCHFLLCNNPLQTKPTEKNTLSRKTKAAGNQIEQKQKNRTFSRNFFQSFAM